VQGTSGRDSTGSCRVCFHGGWPPFFVAPFPDL
jgi:hypothetical protein